MHRLVVALLVALVGASTMAGAAEAQGAPSGPVASLEEVPYDVGLHGHPLWDPWFDIAAFGYEATEYFASGTATADGGTDTADYVTRIIVVHPTNPAEFSGTVMLDWVNVTAQFENAVNTATSIQFLLREGWAWAHVSAQAAGICCTPGLTPQTWDPVRYGSLSHPGDQYANDIFSQVARAFKQPGEVHPLRGMTAEVVIAAGQSQGGSRLTDYVKQTPVEGFPLDGFLTMANGNADAGKTFDVAPPVPVLNLLGEREGTPVEPTPHDTYMLWEVAGAAHQDSWVGRQQTEGQSTRLAGAGRQSRAMAEALWLSAGNYGEQLDPRQGVCIVNGALFPNRYAANAALWHIDRWIRDGTPPPTPDRYQFDDGSLAKDADGNTLGGLRYPPIDVPVATYLADSCNLGGVTIPFTDAQLMLRYGSHADYFASMVEATQASVDAGYLLYADALDLLDRACNAANRFGEVVVGRRTCEVDLAPAAAPAEPEPEPGPAPEPEPAPQPAPLPATGGGLVAAALLFVAAASTTRRTWTDGR